MLVQLDGVHQRGGGGSQKAYVGSSYYEDSIMPSDSISMAPAASGSASTYVCDPDDDPDIMDALVADLEEFDLALSDLDLNHLAPVEIEAFAMEAQKMYHRFAPRSGKPNYRAARDKLAQGKVNRGWRSNVDATGSVKMDSKDMNDKLSMLKAKSNCHACGQIGHW
eukprot:6989553-Heterocapsa_arctica.AAC.1